MLSPKKFKKYGHSVPTAIQKFVDFFKGRRGFEGSPGTACCYDEKLIDKLKLRSEVQFGNIISVINTISALNMQV